MTTTDTDQIAQLEARIAALESLPAIKEAVARVNLERAELQRRLEHSRATKAAARDVAGRLAARVADERADFVTVELAAGRSKVAVPGNLYGPRRLSWTLELWRPLGMVQVPVATMRAGYVNENILLAETVERGDLVLRDPTDAEVAAALDREDNGHPPA